ncbi:MAG: hypothetical protein JWL73_226, partial [Actinomycetia bacterium]|nr:hypothetical protein [Actinomycetes bacterium]
MSTGRPARRAMVRWAVRLFRREWRQQLLVLALMTVTVAAAVAGTTSAVNAANDSSGEYGRAGALIRIDGADAATARSGIATARKMFGPVEVIRHTTVPVPGSVTRLDVRDQSPNGRYGTPMLALREGHYPKTAHEVALTRGAATVLGAGLDRHVTLGPLTARVVGIVENPGDLSDDFALVAPGTLASPTSYSLLLDTGASNLVPAAVPGQVDFRVRGPAQDKVIATTVLAATALALALAGLVGAAGFVVVAQRRQRQLGLVSAIGATDEHVRLVMIANGAIVGITAAVVGAALGFGGWMLAASAVESAANHRIDRFHLPWTLILAVIALSVVMATAAAWWPARTASKLPVMAALSGRPTRPEPVHRSILLALTFVVAGVIAIGLSRPRTPHLQPLLLCAGLLAVAMGAVLAAPAAI